MLYYVIAILIIGVDQLSKWLIVNYLDLYESIPIIEGWIHITSTRNKGAAFSILQNQRLFFIVLTLFVVIFIIYYIYKIHKEHRFFSLILALILGGAIGNLIDRIATGEVIDFIDFRIINFAIFNIADSAVVVGTTLMLFYMVFAKENNIFK
ncbi:MAG: signal peptidase II [Vulcanibacillus sp.]